MSVQAENIAARPFVSCWPRDSKLKLDLSPYVVDLEVNTALDPPGMFQLVLAADALRMDALASIRQRIRLQALITVGVLRPGGLMMGLVDSVSTNLMMSGGQPTYVVTVRGTDIGGKALTRDNVVKSFLTEQGAPQFFEHLRRVFPNSNGRNHPLLTSLSSAFGPTSGDNPIPLFTSRTVAEVVSWIVSEVPTMMFPMLAHAIGGSGKIGEYIDTSHSVTTWNDQRIYSEDPQNYSGSLLGFVQAVVDMDFYEVFTAAIPSSTDLPTVALVVRPKPFDDPAGEVAAVAEDPGITWQALRTLVGKVDHHEIPRTSIHQMSTTMSDAKAFAYYQVTSAHELMSNDQQFAEGMRFPLVDTFIATKFGVRTMEPRLSLVAPAFNEKVAGTIDYEGEVPAAVREFRNRLFNWYRWNPWFEEGSITVHGNDDYRPGDKLYLPDYQHPYSPVVGMLAYCVGVSWRWALGQPYVTTLRFERGHNEQVLAAAKQEIATDALRYGVPPTHYTET